MAELPVPVLVVDDDRAIRDSLARALQLEGYQVTTAADGQAALDTLAQRPMDLIILDVMMPQLDGLQVCRQLRESGDNTPILMLTARVETSDRVAGLDAGADDYLPKPFELEELLARVRALLRRTQSWARPSSAQLPEPNSPEAVSDHGDGDRELTVGDLRLDPAARRVWRGEDEIDLTRTEFNLLELLMRHQGVVLDHSTIYDRIWGYDFGPESKNLAVYISYLRRKIETDDRPELIHTARGVGYMVREP